jgi:hypothetical protein
VKPLLRQGARLFAGAVLIASLLALAPVTPASASVSGLEVRQAVSTLTGFEPFKPATAHCSPGKVVVGTGFRITGGNGDIMLDDLIPTETAVTVGAFVDQDGAHQAWTVTAIAVCAVKPAGWHIATVSTDWAFRTEAEISAPCEPGTRALGGGAEVFGSQGQVSIDDVFPGQNSSHTKGFVDGDGNQKVWGIRAYAICAFDPGGLTVEFPPNSSGLTSATSIVGFEQCSPGKRLISTGWDFINSLGHVLIETSLPTTAATQLQIHEDDAGYAAQWRYTTIAVCADA